MSQHHVRVDWSREAHEDFAANHYSRAHHWTFEGGFVVPASASPHVVPPPYSVAENVDPEGAFVASLSSCHMLWFLSLAARRGLVVDSYRDCATGVIARSEQGRSAMSKVSLRPTIVFRGARQPSRSAVEALHHSAHQLCFIANSVKTEVVIEAG